MKGIRQYINRKIFLLALLLGANIMIHFLTPVGNHQQHLIHILARKLFLVPIVMAAVWFELPGGLITSVIAALVYALHILIDWRGELSENINQVAEIFTFFLVGLGTGAFVRAEKRLEQAVKKERERADIDPLTKLLSRSYFENHLSSELKRATLHGYPLSVCLIDIDHFKRVNDQFGHLAGDCALTHLAEQIKELKRESDITIRFGGDEFLVLLPGTKSYDARKWGEKLQQSLQETPLRLEDPFVPISLSVSVGIAQYQPESDSEKELLRRADEDLYERKKANRVSGTEQRREK